MNKRVKDAITNFVCQKGSPLKGYAIYYNTTVKRIILHRINCGQLLKNSGEHSHKQGGYIYLLTGNSINTSSWFHSLALSLVRALSPSAPHYVWEIKECSFCK